MRKKSMKLSTLAGLFTTTAGAIAVASAAFTGPLASASRIYRSTILSTPVTFADYQKDMINSAASVYVTPHGQDFFTKDMIETFLRNGISLEDGDFAKWSPPSFDTIHLDSLSSPMQKFGPTLGSLRDTIKKWLIGFQFNDPKISLQVDGIDYKAEFRRLGVRTDPVKTMALQRDNSIIVDLELEIPAISLSVGSVRATDANNKSLGTFGVNQFSTTMASSSKPLKFRVPIQINLDSNHHVQIQALAVETNLQLVDLDWSFAHPLVLPVVQVVINGKASTLSYDQLEKDVLSKERDLAKAAQTFLKNYLAENGPKLLNDRFQEANLNTLLDEINSIPPIGAPDCILSPPDLLWGLEIQNLKLNQQFLQVDANSFVVDPQKDDVALPSQPHIDTPADLSDVDPSTYDIALALDQSFVDRLLQLSFNRGYFANVKSGDTTIKLLQAPVISADPSGQKGHVKLHLSIENVVEAKGWTQSLKYFLAIRNPLQVAFDMDVKVVVDKENNRIKLVENQVDLDSMVVDPSFIKNGLTKQVIAGVKDYFSKNVNAPLTVTPSELANLPMPKSIIGVPLQINTVEAQTNGHFVLYFSYGDTK
jgi:hypothetical protein